MILMLPFLLITLHFSQIGFTEDLTFMMNPPFFAPSAPCRGIFCCKLLGCAFFLWVRKKSTRKSSFYSIAFCPRKCKEFFTYFFTFFCSFSVHFFISPTGKKKNRQDRFFSLSLLFLQLTFFFALFLCIFSSLPPVRKKQVGQISLLCPACFLQVTSFFAS